MDSMTKAERAAWMHGTERESEAIGRRVTAGTFACDGCGDVGSIIGHGGAGTTARVTCVSCFRSDVAEIRASRVSRAELFARVSAAIA